MEHFVELILELLFGISKHSPDQMPEIEFNEHFTVKYKRKQTIARICASLIVIIIFSLLWFLIKHETRILFAVFVFLGAIIFALSIYTFSFVCNVNDIEISRKFLLIFSKKIKWCDVRCVRVVEQSNEKAVIIALYNQIGKCVLDFNTDMENVWYIVKMAEHLSIYIKYDKDLSLKQMSHL